MIKNSATGALFWEDRALCSGGIAVQPNDDY